MTIAQRYIAATQTEKMQTAISTQPLPTNLPLLGRGQRGGSSFPPLEGVPAGRGRSCGMCVRPLAGQAPNRKPATKPRIVDNRPTQ